MSSSSRNGAIISLVGVALIVFGLFLPMFTESNPQVPGSIHPVYEWQTVAFGPGQVTILFTIFAALPLLGMLIVLAISVATLFQVPLLRLVGLKRVAAAFGLAIQFFLEMIIFLISLIGYGRIDIAWGFVVILIGFIVMFVGTLPLKLYSKRASLP